MRVTASLCVDVISDVVCPWCYLGRRRLDEALARLAAARPEVTYRLRWFPFFLNPDTPPEGEPYRPFLERKFGGAAEVDAMHARLAEVGAGAGVMFRFERMTVRPNTLNAHRLVHRAQQEGFVADVLVDALFKAHFEEGLNVGSPDTLQQIGLAIGMGDVKAWLAGDDAVEAARALDRRVRELGVSGVPMFIFNGQIAVSGAQPVAVLLDAAMRSLDASPAT